MVLENLLVIPPLPNLSDSRCRAFCNSLKGNVTSLAASSRFHISAHSVNFVNLAANLSEWPVLGNQMVRNAQGSMSHKPPGFPQTHPWVWLFQCGWAQWMGHCHCLSQLCPCSPGGWVALGRWRDPSLLLSSGRTENWAPLWAFCLPWLLARDSSEIFSSTFCSYWRWRWTRAFTSQHHKKLPRVGHSPWIFYKKVIIDFIAECQIHFSPFWEPFNKLYVLR